MGIRRTFENLNAGMRRLYAHGQIAAIIRRIARLPAVVLALGPLFVAPVAAASSSETDSGFAMSISQGTQGNLDELGIGVGYVGGGDFLDEKGVRHTGLHATLDIAIEGEPSQFRQPDVCEGQTVTVGGYRIVIDRIVPDGERGTVILRVFRNSAT